MYSSEYRDQSQSTAKGAPDKLRNKENKGSAGKKGRILFPFDQGVKDRLHKNVSCVMSPNENLLLNGLLQCWSAPEAVGYTVCSFKAVCKCICRLEFLQCANVQRSRPMRQVSCVAFRHGISPTEVL